MGEKTSFIKCPNHTRHRYHRNQYGDRLCQYCFYSPDEWGPLRPDQMTIIRKVCECGHKVSDHKFFSCTLCDCKNPIFGLRAAYG